MNKQEMMFGVESIIQITMYYCHSSVPNVDDWHAVHSIAEAIYDELERGEGEIDE